MSAPPLVADDSFDAAPSETRITRTDRSGELDGGRREPDGGLPSAR